MVRDHGVQVVFQVVEVLERDEPDQPTTEPASLREWALSLWSVG